MSLSPSISPYSILRKSGDVDVGETIQRITMGIGPRSTRAQLLHHLALKKKLEKVGTSPQGLKSTTMRHSRNFGSLNSSIDTGSHIQSGESNGNIQQVRMRNKRGEYQTIDAPRGGSHRNRGSTNSANDSVRGSFRHYQEINKAEERLRVIEQISKYREDKIKREFLKLENDLRQEEEKQQTQIMKEIKMQEYHRKQKLRI